MSYLCAVWQFNARYETETRARAEELSRVLYIELSPTFTGTSFAFTARVRELSKCCCCTDTLTLTHHHDILNSICTRACDGMTQYTQQKHMCYKAINNAYQQTSLCVCGTVLRTHLAKFQAETHSHTQKSNLSFFIDFKLNIRKHAIVQNERSVWSRLELFIVYTT